VGIVISNVMESGQIVEFIDRQKIMCAVVLEVKKPRLRLLTENNRELNVSAARLLHTGDMRLELSVGRDKLVETLREVVRKRKALTDQVDIQDLWEVLNTEQEWIDLATMTEFCFPNSHTGDHESAVLRAFFDDRLYFKFNPDRFFPHTAEHVDQLRTQQQEAARRNRIIEKGGEWLALILKSNPRVDGRICLDDAADFIQLLKNYYLCENDCKDADLAKAMLERGGLKDHRALFRVLVNVGVFDENENIDLHRFEIPSSFASDLIRHADQLIGFGRMPTSGGDRRDLTSVTLTTIDGQATLDYDDALSLEEHNGGFRLGVHIVDVAESVPKGDPVDQEALLRGSSIYMPDQKISMLPPSLAEGLCSLKAGEIRPAISTLIQLSADLDILGYEVVPSVVRVTHQLTYYDVNLAVDAHRELSLLQAVAKKFRKFRLEAGAVQITVPEINVWINENGEICVTKVNREGPGRVLVSELMIMANWLAARFLCDNGLPAIFRSQPEPRDRLYRGEEGTFYQNWMQRRLLSRFVLSTEAEFHSGLALDAYITATSPIRKYSDLVTQRQIRSIFGFETPYSAEEISAIIQQLEIPMGQVARIQASRHRYWLLKSLEKRVGQKEEAMVLQKRRRAYQILLTEYMLECDLPMPAGQELAPEDLVQVTIQQVSARDDVLVVSLG
jgi:exoribonuclease II